MSAARYRCIECQSAFRTGADDLTCGSCARSYPVLGGSLPVFLREPTLHLAQALTALHRSSRELRAELESPPRQAAALESEAAHAEALARVVRPHLTPHELARAHMAPPPAGGPWSGGTGLRMARGYLRRDWSGRPECEEEVATVMAAVRGHIERHCHSRDAALVVGSGLGRFGWELRDDFSEVYAVDSSFAMTGTLHLLHEAPLDIVTTNEHVRTREDEQVAFRATLREHPAGTGRFHYAVGEATALPFASESLSCVVCIFFTSVPSALLVANVLRVLEVGGLFVHFGPPMTSVEETRASLVAGGFELVEETFVENTLDVSSSALYRGVWQNWSACARKARPARLDEDWTPALVGDLGCELAFTVTDDSRQNHDALLTHPAIGSLRVEEPLFSFLTLLDGERTVRDVLAELVEHGMPAAEGRRMLEAPELSHLIAAGLLRVEAASR